MRSKPRKPAPKVENGVPTFVRLSGAERDDLKQTGRTESRDMSKQLLHAARVGWRALYGRELGGRAA